MNSVIQPGVRERHLLRKKDNPLFDEAQRDVSNEMLAQARLEDGIEMDRFIGEFQALVQKTVDLEPNTPSETILEIKEELDRSYQRACALPGDQTQIKNAVRKLVSVIMRAVRSGIGDDAYAARKLDEEDIARQAHFELQELPLVTALTHPDSPIEQGELIPSLLSEPAATLRPTLQVFDEDQLATISSEAARFLKEKDPHRKLVDAWQRLGEIETCYHNLQLITQPD